MNNIIIIYNIIKQLDIDDNFKCGLVCKNWFKLTQKNEIWELLFLKRLFQTKDDSRSLKRFNIENNEIDFKCLYRICFKNHFYRVKNYNQIINNNIISNFKDSYNDHHDDNMNNNIYKKQCYLANSILNSIQYNNSIEFNGTNNTKCILFINSIYKSQSSFVNHNQVKNIIDIKFLIFVPTTTTTTTTTTTLGELIDEQQQKQQKLFEYSKIIKIRLNYCIQDNDNSSFIEGQNFRYKFKLLDLDHFNSTNGINNCNFKIIKEIVNKNDKQDYEEMIGLDDIGFNLPSNNIFIPKSILNQIESFSNNTFSIYSKSRNNELYTKYLSPLFSNSKIPIYLSALSNINNNSNCSSIYGSLESLKLFSINIKSKLTFLKNIFFNKPVEFMFYPLDDIFPTHYYEYNDPSEQQWYNNDKIELYNLIENSTILKFNHNFSIYSTKELINLKSTKYNLIISIPIDDKNDNNHLILNIKYNSKINQFSIHYKIIKQKQYNKHDIVNNDDEDHDLLLFYNNLNGIESFDHHLQNYKILTFSSFISKIFKIQFPVFKFKLLSLLIVTNLDQFMSLQFHNLNRFNDRLIKPLQANEDLEHMYGFNLNFDNFLNKLE